MAEKINDGGPAFPIPELSQNQATGETTVHQTVYPGITVRDYFAAKAMPVCFDFYWSNVQIGERGGDDEWRMGVSLDAYAMADAMLKARGAA